MRTESKNIKNKFGLILLLLLALASFKNLSAQFKADDIIGIWEFKDKTSKMETYKEENKYFGKLLYGTEMINKDGSSKKDIHNPDTKLKNQDLIGSTYILDLVLIMMNGMREKFTMPIQVSIGLVILN